MSHVRQQCGERDIPRPESAQPGLRRPNVQAPGIGLGGPPVEFAGRQRLIAAENEGLAALADVELRGREVLHHHAVLREGRRHEGLRRDDQMVDSHAAALRGVSARARLLDGVVAHPALLLELVQQRLLLLDGLLAVLFVEKGAQRQRDEVDIVEIVSRNDRRIRALHVGGQRAHVHRRVAPPLEDEEVAHVAAVANAATHRAGLRLDRRVARNEQNRDLHQRNRRVVAEREVLGAQLAEQRLIGNVPIVEEVEEHGALRPRQEEKEVILVSVDRSERFFRCCREDFDFVRSPRVDRCGAHQTRRRHRIDVQHAGRRDGEGVVAIDVDGGERGEQQEGRENGEVVEVALVVANVLCGEAKERALL